MPSGAGSLTRYLPDLGDKRSFGKRHIGFTILPPAGEWPCWAAVHSSLRCKWHLFRTGTSVTSLWCPLGYGSSVTADTPFASLTGGIQFVTVNQSFTNL